MKIDKKVIREGVIARSGIPRLSLRGWRSQPKQSHDRLGTGSAIPPPFPPPRGGRIKEGVIRLLRGACPEQNNEILRFAQNDRRRRVRNDIASSECGFALVIVMVVLLMMTILGLNAIMTTNTDIQISGNERVSANGLLMADAGLQHALRVLRGQNFDTLLAGAVSTANNPDAYVTLGLGNVSNSISFNGWTYAISIRNNHKAEDVNQQLGFDAGAGKNVYNSDTDSRIIVRSTATNSINNNITKIVEAGIEKISAEFTIPGGLGVAGTLEEMDVDGNAFRINGNDTTPPASKGNWAACPTANDNRQGIAVSNCKSRCAIVGCSGLPNTDPCYTSENPAFGAGDTSINNITGYSGGPVTGANAVAVNDTVSSNDIINIVNKLTPYADTTINIDRDTTMQNISWGTFDNPQITVVNFTDCNDERELRIEGNSKGYGILILNSTCSTKGGEFDLRGNFEWYGLIVFAGYSEAEIGHNGNISINGGMLLANTGTNDGDNEIEIRGNTTINYSCSAMENTQKNSKFLVSRWHEIRS